MGETTAWYSLLMWVPHSTAGIRLGSTGGCVGTKGPLVGTRGKMHICQHACSFITRGDQEGLSFPQVYLPKTHSKG